MREEEAKLDKAVQSYLKTYLQPEIVQSADEADGDPQLGSVVGVLNEKLIEYTAGELVDLGCGHGSLLARLSTLPAFRDSEGWTYRAVDFDEKLDEVVMLARRLKLLPRIRPMNAEDFASSSLPDAAETLPGTTRIFFCRNVFHELKIPEAARLIHSTCLSFASGDLFFVQDLLRFPEGERNHHCWLADGFAEALRCIGFRTVSVYSQLSRSGNAWFNLTARDLGEPRPTLGTIHDALLKARMDQWRVWSALQSTKSNLQPRGPLVDALDTDLQLASLTRELRGMVGVALNLDPDVERRIRTDGITRRIEALAAGSGLSGAAVSAPARFRERGAQLTIAEEFLRSQSRLAIVHGGRGTGRTTFIEHLLAGRLYEKTLVSIDARTARGFWPMLEVMMSQLGVNLAANSISVLDDLRYDHLRASIGALLNRFATSMVVVVENLDAVLDTNYQFTDPQVEAFLLQLIGKDGIKVIVSSRSDIPPTALQRSAGRFRTPPIRMGRYATEDTVTNVLDDYFDRAGAGVTEYPQALLDAIDRHPLIAALAGRILRQEGSGVLLDARFLRQLKQRLRTELVARLVDGASDPALEVATELRVPVPARVIEALAGRDSLHHAKVNEVVYTVPDRRWGELLTALGLFRKRDVDDLAPASEQDVSDAAGSCHGLIAEQLERVYREDDNPKWIRESYYHRMLAGQTKGLGLSSFVGKYYLTELVASANYCFEKQRDYDAALGLFEAAQTIAPLDENSLMRRASSLVRTGSVREGNGEYERLFAAFPNNVGMRRSHVDALLFRKEFCQARSALNEHALDPERDVWHARQWGRTELGLHNYGRAIEILGGLRKKTPDKPEILVWLARALQQFGDVRGAIDALRKGISDFPANIPIRTSLATNLERDGEDGEAEPLLRDLFSRDEGNARASWPLVRVLLRSAGAPEARTVARAALRRAHADVQAFALMAQAELLLADNMPEGAADLLRQHSSDEEDSAALLIDALRQAAERAETDQQRTALLAEAASVRQSEALRHNVPIQIALVRLAVARRDRTDFDAAVTNLSGTRLDDGDLQRLRELWQPDPAP